MSARRPGTRSSISSTPPRSPTPCATSTATSHLATPDPVARADLIGEVLRSALAAEEQAERFARAGGRGVVLRFGLLDGPGTWFDKPMGDFGSTLHVSDAGRALLSALSLPSGIYNVCRDGERVSAERFSRAVGWHPTA